MRSKQLLIATTIILLAISYTSCKKDTKEDADETTQISQDQAISDNITEDVNDMFTAAAEQKNLMGERPSNDNQPNPADITGLPACATVTVSPAGLIFPKTIVVDFGVACTSASGIVRSGKINILISDSVRKSGSTATITFDNYYVNGYMVEGSILWTNTSSGQIKSWTRKVENGKITVPNGSRFWTHSGTKTIVQTAGTATPRYLTDDVYSITGSHNISNSSGHSRTATIVEPLQKKTICENIDKGKIRVEGSSHYAIIDFGNGECDRVATISFDGGTPYSFFLR